MRFQRLWLTAWLNVAAAAFCAAQTYTITNVTTPTLSGGLGRIGVGFNKSIAAADQGVISSKNRWSVFKYLHGNPDPIGVEPEDARFVPDDQAELTVKLDQDERVVRWVVILNAFTFPSGSTTPPSGTGASSAGVFDAATSRKDANLYVSGALAAAEKSKPQYAIDSALQFYKDLGIAGALGLEASVVANQGPEVDPDSIRSFLTYRKIVAIRTTIDSGAKQGGKDNTGAALIFDIFGIGGEFNRGSTDPKKLLEKPQVSNLIYASPQVTFLVPRWAILPDRLMLEPEVLAGVELGSRLESLPRQSNDSRIARLLFGSNLYLYTPSSAAGRRLMITGQYRLRGPKTDEPYGFKDGSGVFHLVHDQRKRHYVSTDVEFLFTPGLALSVKYKWGSLPPLFPAITHQVSLGIAILVKQNGNF